MTNDERMYLINLLVMFTNKTESYFIHMGDVELEKEYDRLTNER
jgi:hypothetical protein